MLGFHFDEFTEPNFNRAWLQTTGSPSYIQPIVNMDPGRVRVTLPAGKSGVGCYYWFFQGHWNEYPQWPAPNLTIIPDDFFAKFTFPASASLPETAWGYNVQIWFYDIIAFDVWDGDLGAWFVWDDYGSGYQWNLGGWADWNEYADGIFPDPVGLGTNITEGWIRLQSKPGELTRIYYALSEPKFESDWTEFPMAGNGYYKTPGAGGQIALHVQGDAEELSTDANFYFEYIRPWFDDSLRRQMFADLEDVFYNVEEFAKEIIYTPRGESAQVIRAVVLAGDSPLEDPEVLGDTLRIRVRTRDIAKPDRDEIILDGRKYHVVRNAGGGPQVGEWELEISQSEQRIL